MGIACQGRPGAGTSVVDRGEAARRLTIDGPANPPLNPTKPTGSPRNLEAHSGSGLRCIIGQRLAPSRVNGRPFDRPKEVLERTHKLRKSSAEIN